MECAFKNYAAFVIAKERCCNRFYYEVITSSYFYKKRNYKQTDCKRKNAAPKGKERYDTRTDPSASNELGKTAFERTLFRKKGKPLYEKIYYTTTE